MCIGRFWAEHNGVSERVAAADRALGDAVLVKTVEVVGAEVSRCCSALQQGESGDLLVQWRWP